MAFNGTYKLHSSDKFEAYMKEIGVPEQLISLGNDPNAETSIHSEDGENYVITLTGSGKTSELKFCLGVEFDETTPHGIKVKTVITKDGDQLVQKQSGGFDSVITREIVDGDLKVVLQSGSVTSTRIYKRV